MKGKDASLKTQEEWRFKPGFHGGIKDTGAVSENSAVRKSVGARTSEIPPSEWPAFFKSFSDRHKDWLVSREPFDPDLGGRVAALYRPFLGIAAQAADDGHERVVIALGEKPGHISHVIVEVPEHIRLRENRAGADESLVIETRTGASIVLRFRSRCFQRWSMASWRSQR